ncbi:MAG TPA: hypothetical protein VK422_16715 [Pyrinomonadaceae bacterium]|nr:hypothetical protein [Pyrinomonadaceae bacterium]
MNYPRRFPLRTAAALTALFALALSAAPLRGVAAQERAAQPPAGPNGKIIFQSNRGGDWSDIYVVNADGRHETRLTDDPADDSSAVWSPDGTRIAFVSSRRGTYEIYLMDADGSNQRPLRETAVETVEVEWSPDGKMLTYEVRAGFDVNDIYVVEAVAPGGGDSTAAPVNVTSGYGGFATQASWSPGGTQLVFRGGSDLYIVDASGNNLTQITNTPNDPESDPRWAANGLVAYEGIRNYERAIYVKSADGSPAETKVSGTVGSYGGAVWSPDGSRLAFVATSGAVYSVSPSGAGLTLLTDMAGTSGDPFWSPDGQKVGFRNDGDLHVVNADGTSRRATNYTKTRRAFEQGNSWQKV